MKTFKIKDLNVSIESGAGATPDLCRNPTILCGNPSNLCGNPTVLCQQPTIITCGFISNCNPCTVFVSCHAFSNCGIISHCAGVTICACTHLASLYDPTRDWITTTPVQQGIDYLQEAELTELKNSLAELQKAVDAKLQRSPQELDELETKLAEALEEVRAQKGNVK